MPKQSPGARCDDCGAGMPMFAPRCPDCDAAQSWTTTVPCGDCGEPVDHGEPGSCSECHAPVSPWDAVVVRVRAAGFHVDVPVSDALPHPVAAGFAPGRGKPAGQVADYRRPLADGTEIHVREYADRYRVHRDRRSAEQRLRHLARDTPLEAAAGATALSILLWGVRRLPYGLPFRGSNRLPGWVALRLPGRGSLRLPLRHSLRLPDGLRR